MFLDKDGTLVDDVPFNVDPARVRLAPGADRALPALVEAGFHLVVVSNQSGVARGFFPRESLCVVELRLHQLLGELGVALDGCYFCPHHPDGVVPEYAVECDCRKPAPGLVLRAAEDFGLDLERSWMVGDILNDVEAGRRAGCRTILLDNGHETEWASGELRIPDHVVPDLGAAARVILGDGGP